MNEWIMNNQVPVEDGKFEIIINDSIRTVGINKFRDSYTLWFLDCTHPMQNTYCDRNSIIGWRKLESK